MAIQGLNSVRTQENLQTSSNTAASRPDGILGRIAPFLSRKTTAFCSAAYQSMRAVSPRTLKYHVMKHVTPHQLNQKMLQKAEKLAQNIRQEILSDLSFVNKGPLKILEDREISLESEAINEKVEEAINALKSKYPIKGTLESAVREVLTYHLDPSTAIANKKTIIKEDVLYCKQLSLQQGTFSIKDKMALFASLCQQHVDQHYMDHHHPKEITDFIFAELFPSQANDRQSSIQAFKSTLTREITLKPQTLRINDTHSLKTALPLIEKETDKLIDSLFLPEDIKFIEKFSSISLKSFIENTLLHKISPKLFKEKISEEIQLKIEKNTRLKDAHLSLSPDALSEKIEQVTKKISANCPPSTRFFIRRAVDFQMNKEQTLIKFVQRFLTQAQQGFEYYCENSDFHKNKPYFKNHYIENLLSEYPYIEKESPTLVNHLRTWASSISNDGVYLDKNAFGLENTLIICAKSHEVYALKNTLSHADIADLKAQFPDINLRHIGKHVIGKGGFGKVRFAKNLATGNFVAVKKFTNTSAADDEVESYKAVGTGKNLVALYNRAEVTNKNGQEKSYLFIEFIQGSDGGNYYESTYNNTKINAQTRPEDAKELKRVATEYLSSAVDLHRKGVFHRDIKPDNFLHASNGDIKIIDYGLYTTNIHHRNGGTITYACPEWFSHLGQTHLYDAQKHDSFSLGVSLLYQSSAFEKRALHKKTVDSHGRTYPVNTGEVTTRSGTKAHHYLGFENTDRLAGNNIDEVAMKLMDRDPQKRITPEEALKLPYFNAEKRVLYSALYIGGGTSAHLGEIQEDNSTYSA